MIILSAVVIAILIVTALSFLVMSYNQLLLGWRTATSIQHKIQDIFFAVLEKLAVFLDDYKNYLNEEPGRKIGLAAEELKDWLGRAVKEMSQQWDVKLAEVVAKKLRSFLVVVAPDEKFAGDRNLEFIQKSEATIARLFSGYQKIIEGYNRRIKKFPANLVGNLKKLPQHLDQ